MNLKNLKNDSKYEWTEHSKFKMQYYGLSPQRIMRVIKNPYRTEIGIVENTIAVMQPSGNIKKSNKQRAFGRKAFSRSSENSEGETWSQEIWVMYRIRNQELGDGNQEIQNLESQINKIKSKEKSKKLMKLIPKKLRIISAWRYPGVSPENDPIPSDILRELEEII